MLRYPELDEISHLGSRFLPLFPDAHADSMIQPAVDVLYGVLHIRNTVVVQPSSDIHLQPVQCRAYALNVPSGTKVFQICFQLLP